MKKLSVLALALAGFAIPQIAKADQHRMFVSKIVKINDTQCAVELTHTSDEHGFESGTAIKFGTTNPPTTVLASLGTFEATIDGAVNNNGSKILAASPDFAGTSPAERESRIFPEAS